MRVTVVGHSQLPKEFRSYLNTEIHLCRQGGALLDDLLEDQGRLRDAVAEPCDVIFVFLGGNDLFHIDHQLVKTKLIEVANLCAAVATHVYITLLEPRDYTKHPRPDWKARAVEYNKKRVNVNNFIKRYVRRTHQFRTPNFGFERFAEDQDKGVHFNRWARISIWTRFRTLIEKSRAELHLQ